MDWTDETIARLRVFWDEGHSTAEIGRRLGVTKNAVVGKAHRLSLPARPSPIRRSNEGALPVRRAVSRRTPPPTLASLVESVSIPEPAEMPRAQPVMRVISTPRPAGRSTACCWPIGEPGTSDFHFCSDSALSGKPYCSRHAAVAYVRLRDRRDDAA